VNAAVEKILRCLNSHRIRATYGVVGEKIGVPAIGVGAQLGARRPDASWVVSAETGLPVGYTDAEMHPALRSYSRIIRKLVELDDLLRNADFQPAESVPLDSETTGLSQNGISARWLKLPVPTPAFDDLAAMVKAARKARRQRVEFDWTLTEDELRSLRAAVHEWGSRSVGSYKAFDARVLSAINDALGEADSMLFLTEPRRSGNPDFTVRCIKDGDIFRAQRRSDL
jgi:hypothetical protein